MQDLDEFYILKIFFLYFEIYYDTFINKDIKNIYGRIFHLIATLLCKGKIMMNTNCIKPLVSLLSKETLAINNFKVG